MPHPPRHCDWSRRNCAVPRPALDAALADYVTAGARRDVQRPFYANSAPVSSWPFQADALSMLGRHAQAQALIGRTPLDCYDCVRIRGLVAKRNGDPAAAQRWFAVAVRQGPSLPAAFSDWGTLLLDARRYRSAEVKLREASRLAPNWADPLKSWGDLLAAQGKREEALAKYDAALKLAPKWVGLRKARDAVAARPSRACRNSGPRRR